MQVGGWNVGIITCWLKMRHNTVTVIDRLDSDNVRTYHQDVKNKKTKQYGYEPNSRDNVNKNIAQYIVLGVNV